MRNLFVGLLALLGIVLGEPKAHAQSYPGACSQGGFGVMGSALQGWICSTNTGVSATIGTPTLFLDTADFWGGQGTGSAPTFRSGAVLNTTNTNETNGYFQCNTTKNINDTIGFQKDCLAVYYETNDPIDPTINLGSGSVATDFRGIVPITNPYGNAWANDAVPGIVFQAVTGAVNNGSGACRITLGTSISPVPTTGMNGNSVVAHDIGGTTGCAGTFVANVISNTQVDLVGSQFGGAYTSGGAISGEGYITGYEVDVYQGGVSVSSPNGAVLGVVSSVVNNGSGNCRINVSGTPFTAANGWTTGMWASVGGIKGATGCNGTFLVTINSTSQVDLQNSVFGGAYTSGGGITGGRPKFAYQAAAFGTNHSTAAYAIFGFGSTKFYHGLVAQQNALVTDFINLYSGNGLSGASVFTVDTTGSITSNATSWLLQNAFNGRVSFAVNNLDNNVGDTAVATQISLATATNSAQVGVFGPHFTAVNIFAPNDMYLYSTGNILLDADNTGVIKFGAKGEIEVARIASGFAVGSTTDPGAGVINALNGYQSGGTAGVTCNAGISATTGRSVLGIITHC